MFAFNELASSKQIKCAILLLMNYCICFIIICAIVISITNTKKLTFRLFGCCDNLSASTHLTVLWQSSQSGTWSTGWWKVILLSLHFIVCAFSTIGCSEQKVTVTTLEHSACRWPTCGEKLSCGSLGSHSKRSTLELLGFVMVKVSW